jgi:hypothetical protein
MARTGTNLPFSEKKITALEKKPRDFRVKPGDIHTNKFQKEGNIHFDANNLAVYLALGSRWYTPRSHY